MTDHLPGLHAPHPSFLRNDSVKPTTINLHAEDPFLLCLQHPSHICSISYQKKILWPSSLPVLFSRQRWSSIAGSSGHKSSPDLCCPFLSTFQFVHCHVRGGIQSEVQPQTSGQNDGVLNVTASDIVTERNQTPRVDPALETQLLSA